MRRSVGLFAYSSRAIQLIWTTSRSLTPILAVLTVVAVCGLPAQTPDFSGVHYNIARIRLRQQRPNEALTLLEAEPGSIWQVIGQPLVFHALGRKAESDAALAELIDKYAGDAAFQVAEAYAYRGETDKAFEWLDRAYAQRDGGLTELKWDPLLESLRTDPRYAALLEKMNLAD